MLIRDGHIISTLDLYVGTFVVMTGPDGEAWRAASAEVAERLAIVVDCHRIGEDVHASSDFCDAYGISANGAVLVRPDGYVAWRSHALPDGDHPADVLEAALRQVLSATI